MGWRIAVWEGMESDPNKTKHIWGHSSWIGKDSMRWEKINGPKAEAGDTEAG